MHRKPFRTLAVVLVVFLPLSTVFANWEPRKSGAITIF